MQAVISNRLLASLKPQEREYEVRDTAVKGFMVRVRPSGRMVYAVQYGRGKRYTIGAANVLKPEEARDQARQILAEAAKGNDPMEAKRQAKREAEAHTLETYITEVYAPWAEAHHSHGKATVRIIATNFFPTLGKTKLEEITPWSLEKWRSERLKAGLQASSLNRYINPLKAALRHAVDWNLLSENPLTRVKPLRIDTLGPVRFLTDEEDERLRAALDAREETMQKERETANEWRRVRGYELLPEDATDHLKPMVILDLNTGLRRGELFKLEWADVDMERALLTVRKAKNKQTRYVSLNDEALETLKGWRKRSRGELVFPGKGGRRLTNVQSSWEKLMRDAQIEDFRFHDMRHDFASKLVMAGVDLNTVRELLGHADIKMTLRYAHLAPHVKAEAVARLDRRKAGDGDVVSIRQQP